MLYKYVKESNQYSGKFILTNEEFKACSAGYIKSISVCVEQTDRHIGTYKDDVLLAMLSHAYKRYYEGNLVWYVPMYNTVMNSYTEDTSNIKQDPVIPAIKAKQKTQYICFEGNEGVGKTTQIGILADSLRMNGYSVLVTSEPGTPHIPLSQTLRGYVLDNQYKDVIPPIARELLLQTIRMIHLTTLIRPAIKNNTYDFILQDRGIMSGIAYGLASGHSIPTMMGILRTGVDEPCLYDIYDRVVYLDGDTIHDAKRAAKAKQEFEAGDVRETQGELFLKKVTALFHKESNIRQCEVIDTTGKSITEVHDDILYALGLTYLKK